MNKSSLKKLHSLLTVLYHKFHLLIGGVDHIAAYAPRYRQQDVSQSATRIIFREALARQQYIEAFVGNPRLAEQEVVATLDLNLDEKTAHAIASVLLRYRSTLTTKSLLKIYQQAISDDFALWAEDEKALLVQYLFQKEESKQALKDLNIGFLQLNNNLPPINTKLGKKTVEKMIDNLNAKTEQHIKNTTSQPYKSNYLGIY